MATSIASNLVGQRSSITQDPILTEEGESRDHNAMERYAKDKQYALQIWIGQIGMNRSDKVKSLEEIGWMDPELDAKTA